MMRCTMMFLALALACGCWDTGLGIFRRPSRRRTPVRPTRRRRRPHVRSSLGTRSPIVAARPSPKDALPFRRPPHVTAFSPAIPAAEGKWIVSRGKWFRTASFVRSSRAGISSTGTVRLIDATPYPISRHTVRARVRFFFFQPNPPMFHPSQAVLTLAG